MNGYFIILTRLSASTVPSLLSLVVELLLAAMGGVATLATGHWSRGKGERKKRSTPHPHSVFKSDRWPKPKPSSTIHNAAATSSSP